MIPVLSAATTGRGARALSVVRADLRVIEPRIVGAPVVRMRWSSRPGTCCKVTATPALPHGHPFGAMVTSPTSGLVNQ